MKIYTTGSEMGHWQEKFDKKLPRGEFQESELQDAFGGL